MKPMIRLFASLIFGLSVLVACSPKEAPKQQTQTAPTTQDPESASDMLMLQLKDGVVEIKLRSDLAPKHVEQITKLANEGFYDGIIFHRVIEGFMAQTGDPTGTGRGGSSLPNINEEFSSHPFDRGVVGMARSQNPNSANSQFFIMFNDGHFLNNQYTVWGEVTKGMEFVDNITRGEPPVNPDKIIKMRTSDKM